jgi:hypothetical protein
MAWILAGSAVLVVLLAVAFVLDDLEDERRLLLGPCRQPREERLGPLYARAVRQGVRRGLALDAAAAAVLVAIRFL